MVRGLFHIRCPTVCCAMRLRRGRATSLPTITIRSETAISNQVAHWDTTLILIRRLQSLCARQWPIAASQPQRNLVAAMSAVGECVLAIT